MASGEGGEETIVGLSLLGVLGAVVFTWAKVLTSYDLLWAAQGSPADSAEAELILPVISSWGEC